MKKGGPGNRTALFALYYALKRRVGSWASPGIGSGAPLGGTGHACQIAGGFGILKFRPRLQPSTVVSSTSAAGPFFLIDSIAFFAEALEL